MWTIVFYNYSSLFGETQVDDFIKQATKKQQMYLYKYLRNSFCNFGVCVYIYIYF